MGGELVRINPNERKKNYSIIHWETGEPTEGGRYLITLEGADAVSTATFIPDDANDKHFFKEYVTAWCKLSDIEPYKENHP